jgi:protein-L-isoaspartate(D-aspartate) O-methyltransferase
VNLSTGDASKNWHQKRNYDVIVITPAMRHIPATYKNLLKIGGRMFIVTGEAPVMTAHRVTRTDNNKWTVEDLFETSIDPVIQPVKQTFEF